ncbi:MAG: hypothetical protein K6G01_10765 [Eubacterium sp.]|nr:hypothetical protein [Eubacterium sp.]
MIQQISIYTENTKGAMRRLLSVISDAGINVLGFWNGDSGEFGVVRLIVSEQEKALEVLARQGYICKESSVLGIEIDDCPGSLVTLLQVIEQMNINIDYMYVGYRREDARPLIMIHCEDMDIISTQLKHKGYAVD